MGGYTSTVSGQRLGKHVPAATDMNATIEELCFLWGQCRDFISKRQGQFNQLCTVVCEERTLAGGRGIATVGNVTRKRLAAD
jgi:hypothetical protein